MPVITFIDGFTGQKTQKQKELERSKARAHTAHVCHQRRIQVGAIISATQFARRKLNVAHHDSHELPNVIRALRKTRSVDDDKDKNGEKFDRINEASVQHIKRLLSTMGPSWKTVKTLQHCEHGQRVRPQILNRALLGNQTFSQVLPGNTALVQANLDFLFSALCPVNDLATEIFDVRNKYPELVPLLSTPIFSDIGSAVLSADRERATNLHNNLSPVTLNSLGEAMNKVRNCLSRGEWQELPKQEGFLSSVLFLAVFENGRKNVETAEKHFAGLRLIVDKLGGLCALPTNDRLQEKSMLLFMESAYAMSRGVSLFEGARRRWKPEYPALPLNTNISAICEPLPSGFKELASTGNLSIESINLLSRALESRIMHNTPAQQQIRAARRTEVRTYGDFVEACPILLAPDSQSTFLEKMLVYSLFVFCSIVSGSLNYMLSHYRIARQRLCAAVLVYQPQTPVQCRFVIWAHMLAIDSYRARNKLKPEAWPLLEQLAGTFPGLMLQEWPYAESLLCEFFWTDQMTKSWKILWPSVCSKFFNSSSENSPQ